MLNKTQLIGRLGADPEVRNLNDGAKVTNLRLATTESWKDRETGERRERTEWHRVTVWGDGAVNYLSHAAKGAMIFLEGRLCTRNWTDANGVERVSTEVVVESRGNGLLKLLGGRPAKGRTASQPDRGSNRAAVDQPKLSL